MSIIHRHKLVLELGRWTFSAAIDNPDTGPDSTWVRCDLRETLQMPVYLKGQDEIVKLMDFLNAVLAERGKG